MYRMSSSTQESTPPKNAMAQQKKYRLLAGQLWYNEIPDLVFTNELGRHYMHNTVTHNVARIAASIGIESLCFHDLRHTYAVNALRAGADVKTVQSNLGHATAAFTLDRYGHYTDDMRVDSANRMEVFAGYNEPVKGKFKGI